MVIVHLDHIFYINYAYTRGSVEHPAAHYVYCIINVWVTGGFTRGENMAESEKIGVVGWYPVKRHSRILYIRLKDEDVGIYGFKPHDKLKVEIQAIRRAPPEDEALEVRA